jgi:hypothetical protein
VFGYELFYKVQLLFLLFGRADRRFGNRLSLGHS